MSSKKQNGQANINAANDEINFFMAQPQLEGALADDVVVNNPAMPAAALRNEIVFVESNVIGYQALISSLKPGTEIHVFDANRDGLEQIAEVLSGRSGVEAVHIISHGAEATVNLGSLVLTTQNLYEHADQLATIRKSLNPGADIMLYGCDVGAGSDGAAFIAALAQTTGADVAASDDPTGANALGGDWILEASNGYIQTNVLNAENWNGILATTFNFSVGTVTDNGTNVTEVINGATMTVTTLTGSNVANDVDVVSGVFWDTTNQAKTLRISFDIPSDVSSFKVGFSANTGAVSSFTITGTEVGGTVRTYNVTPTYANMYNTNYVVNLSGANDWGNLTKVEVKPNGGGSVTFFADDIIATPSNPAPTDITISATTAPQGVAGVRLANLTGADVMNDTVTFSELSDPSDLFDVSTVSSIDRTGLLSLGAGKSLANGQSANITIRITDSGSNTYDETFTITGSGYNTLTIAPNTTQTFTYNGADFTQIAKLLEPEAGKGSVLYNDSDSNYGGYYGYDEALSTVITDGYGAAVFQTQSFIYQSGASAGIDTFRLGEEYYVVTVGSVNATPTFVGATTTLTVNENASATSVLSLLHVSDTDSGDTETWTQSVAPSHGILNISGATATAGSTNITPGGTISYTPTAGYAGTDSFTIQVSDGTATASRTITVNVTPATPSTPDLATGNDTGTSNSDNKTSATSLDFSGSSAVNDTTSTVRVFLDKNGNGVFDSGTDPTVTTTANNGSWSVTGLSTSGVSDGTYNVYARVTSAVGALNSALSTALSVTLDGTAPTASVSASSVNSSSNVTTAKSSETGTLYLVDTAVAITDQASLTNAINANTAKSAVASVADTDTTILTAGLADGTYKVYAVDASGNISSASANSVIIDSVAPTITAVSSSTANGTYKIGDVIAVTVQFSEAVIVTGIPQLTLETGTTDRIVNYAGGSGTNTLTFNYTVQAGDTSAGLDYFSTTALALNGGTIRDAAANDGVLTLAAPGSLGSLGNSAVIAIDGIAPTLVSSVPADNAVSVAVGNNIVLTFSEDVLAGSGNIVISDGSDTRTIAIADSAQVSISGNVVTINPSSDLNGNAIYSVQLASGVLTDINGNPYAGINNATTLNFGTPDNISPTISAVSITSNAGGDNTYKAGDIVTVTVTLSEATLVTGIPTLALNLGGNTAVASYSSGTGSNTLLFTYTVQAGDTDADGISIDANALLLNGGTLKDATGNDATLSHSAISNQSNQMVDTMAPATPSPADLVSDTGTSSTDNLTSNNTPTFTGTADPGSTVILYDTDGTTVLGTATADGSGNWSISSATMSDGAHTVTTKATDAVGNMSAASNGLGVTIDSGIATPSNPDLTAASDTGNSNTDNLTNNVTPVFIGTAEAGATVTLYDTDGTTVLGSTSADGSGNWSITSATLSGGVHTVTTKATDAAGNISAASGSLTVTVDASIPGIPSSADLISDTGSSSTDNLTSNNTPTFTGTADPGSSVILYDTDGTTILGTVTADGSGNWSITSSTLLDGVHTLTTKATDAAGNVSGASNGLVVTIDTGIATPSIPDLTAATDTGSSNTDNVTQNTTPVFIGAAEAGSTVTLYDTDGTTVLGTTTADGSGSWSMTSSTLSEGSHGISAKATDVAGNISALSSALNINIDTTVPSVPSIPDLTAGSDTGNSNTDNITSDTTPTLTGTAEAGATVTLYDTDGTTALGSALADNSGNWLITSSLLSVGNHTLTAKASDTAGNVSALSSGLNINIPTSASSITGQAGGDENNVEGSSLVYTVTLNAQTLAATTFPLSLSGSASSLDYGSLAFSDGVSYDSNTGLVTVPAGLSHFTVTIPTINDGVAENTESLDLTVDTITGHGNIIDNNPVTASFGPVLMLSEASPYASVAVNFSSPSSSALTFTPSLVSGTAIVGTDTGSSLEYFNGSAWLPAASGVTVAAGNTSVLLRVAIQNDDIYEGLETLTISTGAISGVGIGNSIATATVTIADDGSSSAVFNADNNTAVAIAGTVDNDLKGNDDDGVPESTEVGLSQLATGSNDANGDGISDALQSAVATLAWINSTNFENAVSGNLGSVPTNSIITLSVLNSSGGVESNAQIQSIQVVPAANLPTPIPSNVTTSWDPISYTIAPTSNNPLVDMDNQRAGIQQKVLINIANAGLAAGTFNHYLTYISADNINSHVVAGTPMVNFDGVQLTNASQAGWYDFTARTSGGDGAKYITANGKITGIEITFTSGAFGDGAASAVTANGPISNADGSGVTENAQATASVEFSSLGLPVYASAQTMVSDTSATLANGIENLLLNNIRKSVVPGAAACMPDWMAQMAGNAKQTVKAVANLNGTGNSWDNALTGNNGNNKLSGLDGNDTIYGVKGNDVLIGGNGADMLYGGAGNDTFKYLAVTDSPSGDSLYDSIEDFQRGHDKIDLRSIDANDGRSGNQAFKLVSAFTNRAGQIHFDATSHRLEADTNGDGSADFAIEVIGVAKLTSADILL